MDQMTRNAYRGTPQAFATDARALTWTDHLMVGEVLSVWMAGKGIPHLNQTSPSRVLLPTQTSGKVDLLPAAVASFAFLPYMHSEELAVQKV
jgi:uncharacterized protein (DUF924 family)